MIPRVKLERLQRGLRQVDVAALTKGKVPQYRISLLERGVTPRPDEAEALAKALKINPEELFQSA